MKKRILMSCALAAAPASYADGLTMYGVLDQFVSVSRSGPNKVRHVDDGGVGASRLGFRGVEDLGGGLSAHFTVEGGVNADTGEGTLPGPSFAFTRQSYVGLAGSWGSLSLGRMYTPMFLAMVPADVFGVNTVFSPQILITSVDSQPGMAAFAGRSNNAARYRTPASVPVFGDISLNSAEGGARIMSLAGGYQKGPVYLTYAYQSSKLPAATSKYQMVAGAYVFPLLKVAASHIRNSSTLSTTPSATLTNIGVSVPFGVSSVAVEVTRRHVSGSDNRQNVLVLGYDYNLSKRTALYTRAFLLKNSGKGAVSLGNIPVAASSGDDIRNISFGIRHSF